MNFEISEEFNNDQEYQQEIDISRNIFIGKGSHGHVYKSYTQKEIGLPIGSPIAIKVIESTEYLLFYKVKNNTQIV